MKKIKENKKSWFQTSHFPGVFRSIFAFLDENKDCYNFALSCKAMWEIFVSMLERSSTRYYRLQSLNGKNPVDYSLDLFGNSKHAIKYEFKQNKFVANIDEYESKVKDNKLFQILGKINKKYNKPVCMVSGGYALYLLYKNPRFTVNDVDIFILGNKPTKMEIVKEILLEVKKEFGDEVSSKFGIYSCAKYGLLNLEIKKTDMSTLQKQKKRIIPHGVFNQLTNPKIRGNTERKRESHQYYYYPDHAGYHNYNAKTHWTLDAYGGNYHGQNYEDLLKNKKTVNVFQFIMKDIHQYPSDVFAFFDLDCCKIGYFPGLQMVKCSIGFIRSHTCKINFIDLDPKDASYKHIHRITRYYHRTFIYTSIQCEPLMSYYHTHKNKNIKKMKTEKTARYNYGWMNFGGKKLVRKDGKKTGDDDGEKQEKKVIQLWGYGFGDKGKGSNYYYAVNSNMKTMKKTQFLSEFTKLPFTDASSDPYLATGVGIYKDITTKKEGKNEVVYRYKKRVIPKTKTLYTSLLYKSTLIYK